MSEEYNNVLRKQIEEIMVNEEFDEFVARLFSLPPGPEKEECIRILEHEIAPKDLQKKEKLQKEAAELVKKFEDFSQATVALRNKYGIFSEQDLKELFYTPTIVAAEKLANFKKEVQQLQQDFLNKLSPSDKRTLERMVIMHDKMSRILSSKEEF